MGLDIQYHDIPSVIVRTGLAVDGIYLDSAS